MTETIPTVSEVVADSIGTKTTAISVEISTRFLEHFSEQLYSSPQKAFDELIANGWDAGADFVDINIPGDLSSEKATITVFDNGISMDEDGLRELWHIAFSPKTNNRLQHGRQMVGKFGIGKLATYVLANRLTYIWGLIYLTRQWQIRTRFGRNGPAIPCRRPEKRAVAAPCRQKSRCGER